MTVRVLIADDHPMFREGLRAMLAGRDGFDVVAVVGSGREAVTAAEQLCPDVAVLDLRMPDGDGITATAGIRQVSPTTRVLVLTSFEGQAEIAGALAAGARGYLLKSADPDEIAQAVLTVATGAAVLSDHVLGDLAGPPAGSADPAALHAPERLTAPLDDRFVATVLFSDIVDSTRLAEEQGDTRWTALLDAHDAAVDRQVTLFGGRVVKHTGDGVLATFDTPGQAVRCATALNRAVADLGLQIRVGLHSGELERRGRDIGGVAVHIAARVMAQAQAGQVLVSRTVVELVAGSDIRFQRVGEVDLKGLAGRRELYQIDVGDPP